MSLLYYIYYVIIFAFGLIMGSIVSICIYRLPEDKSVFKPSSVCMNCGETLKFADKIPVFSFIFLKGRCRYCSTSISGRYPLVEILAGLLAVILFAKFGVSFAFAAYFVLMLILLAVFFIDLDHKIIPDELVIVGIVAGTALLVYNIFDPGNLIYGDSYWWTPLTGMVAASGTLFLVAIAGLLLLKTDDAMGMGDVKLYIPIGLFLGWKLVILSLLISVISAGVFGFILIVAGKKHRKDTIPFGPFIVAGTFISIMWGWNIVSWYFLRL